MTDISLHFIGLFDTVAAIADPRRGNINITDAHNPGVNLYLPPGCARKVLQLTARDEIRINFALNSVKGDHQEIVLPGVHSDIGGGYLPIGQERMFLTKPKRVMVSHSEQLEQSSEWLQIHRQAEVLRATGLAGDGRIGIATWETPQPPRGRFDGARNYWMAITLDRSVRGELSLVSLRVMRELAVRHDVPFRGVEGRPDLALPEDLRDIGNRVLEQALAGRDAELDAEEEKLLIGRYIHQSANWNLRSGLAINKPTRNDKRNIYPHTPQNGYPQ